MSQLQREKLFDGIYFNSITDNRFKTNRISINMVVALNKDTASLNALVPRVLRKGYDKHLDFTEFNKYLNALYGTGVGYGVEKIGDNQIIKISTGYIDDKYTLDNENISNDIIDVVFGMLLCPVMENSLLVEREIEIEKASLKERILSQINEKRSYALRETVKLMFKDEPCGIDVLGTIQDVENITPTTLTEAYHNLIKSARIEVMFVGCGDCSGVKALAKEKLSSIERNYVESEKTQIHKPLDETLNHIENMEVSQCKLVMGFAFDDIKPEDTSKFSLMVMVLGGSPTSKLFLNVREKLSLCYYCAARFDRFKGYMTIDAGVENKNVEAAKAEILNQIELLQNGELTQEELNQEKMAMINAFKTVNDSNSGIGEYYLAGVVEDKVFTTEERIEQIENITIEDICECAKALKLDIVYLLAGNQE